MTLQNDRKREKYSIFKVLIVKVLLDNTPVVFTSVPTVDTHCYCIVLNCFRARFHSECWQEYFLFVLLYFLLRLARKRKNQPLYLYSLKQRFSSFLTLWPKKFERQLLWPNASSLHFHSIPNFKKSFFNYK